MEITYEIYRTIERKWGTELYIKNVTVDGEARSDLDRWMTFNPLPVSETRLDGRIKMAIENKVAKIIAKQNQVLPQTFTDREVVKMLKEKGYLVGENVTLDDLADATEIMSELIRLKDLEAKGVI